MIDLEEYKKYVQDKSQLAGQFGFKPTYENPNCYDFQNHLIDWSCTQGRSATFADCGLGKTIMQLVWAENVYRHTNKPVLILAPLSVSSQTVEEAEKFGMEAYRSADGKLPTGKGIITTNYERLKNFDPDDFGGVVCDESSILKNFDGSYKAQITEFMRLVKYRGMYTATPSPNDYIELGTSSEALGYLGYMDMLGQFFKNNEDSLHPAFIGSKWRFKPHGENDFWRWVSSWARAIRKPSDLGFDDTDWVLPELIETDHLIESQPLEGQLFTMPVVGLTYQRQERKKTIEDRCGCAADILNNETSGVAWCHLNAEADKLTSMISGAVNLSGTDKDEVKEEKFKAFRSGEITKLVTKPKIAALGVNWQHCNAATYFTDYSFEQYYQAVRRFWRFGQKRPVTIHNISTQSLSNVSESRKGKAEACDKMFEAMVIHMQDALGIDRFTEHKQKQELPKWL